MAELSTVPFLGTLRVHSVLYGNDPSRIDQAIAHLERAADIAIAGGVFGKISLVYGDCSSTPELEPAVVAHALPGTARILGDARSFRPEGSAEIERQMGIIAQGTAQSYNLEAKLRYTREFVPLVNDEARIHPMRRGDCPPARSGTAITLCGDLPRPSRKKR